MIYFFYFASFLFSPIQHLFETSTILLITFNFIIVTYGYILYFKTGNSLNDAVQASMLATLTFQLCSIVSHTDIISSVNYPIHASALLFFFLTFFALKKNIDFGITLASGATITGFISILITLPDSVVNTIFNIA